MTKIFKIEEVDKTLLPPFPKKDSYTEADMLRIYNKGVSDCREYKDSADSANNFIQSLSPIPTHVEIKMKQRHLYTNEYDVLVKDGYVQVKQWIYE